MKKCKICEKTKNLTEFYKDGDRFRTECKECNLKKYKPKIPKENWKENTGRYQKGHKPPYSGKKMPPEMIERMREVRRDPNAKGRGSYRYQIWKLSVFQRDYGKCIKCGATEKLHAHHIIPWKVDETKRFEVDNGQTLCNSCHSKEEGIPDYGRCTEKIFRKGHKHSEETLKKIRETKAKKAKKNANEQ